MNLKLPESRLLYLAIFGIILAVVIAALGLSKSWQDEWLPIVALVCLFAVGAPFFRPSPGRFSVCLVAFGFFAAVGAYTIRQNSLWAYAAEIITFLTNKTAPTFPTPDLSEITQISVLLLAFLAYICTLLFTRDATAMGVHPEAPTGSLSEPEYKKRLNDFCKSLERNLNDIDRDAQWADQYFVPLDAEVEIRRSSRGVRSIKRLLDALKDHHDQRYFLLLGNPGSGKSVALRKLARDLLKEVKNTGRVPIYLNLRDWRTPPEWTDEALPTPGQIETELRRWLLADLRERLDRYGYDFLARYFTDMESQGRFFFILDSFDEIALLLDVEERHPLIDLFSEAIDRFLAGMHHSRGVLASRLFRKPTARLAAPCILEIRPLSDERIAALAERRLANKGLTDSLFAKRPEFVVSARNPFTAVLLVEYLDDHANDAIGDSFPENRGEIFQHHLVKRFSYCREQLKRADIDDNEFLEAFERIAGTMFQQRSSFEVNASSLPSLLPGVNQEAAIDTLKRARLLRVGTGMNPRISFTHRRFAEYLAARILLKHHASLPLSDIPKDSLWRDTLVLYCEISPEDHARKVAEYCWNEFKQSVSEWTNNSSHLLADRKKIQTSRWLPALHCLRFLVDAFQSRTACLKSFRKELGDNLFHLIQHKADPLISKFSVEACGLLTQEDAIRVLIAALKRNNSFINETAFKACRYARYPSPELASQLCQLLSNKSYWQLWSNGRDLYRQIALAQGFSRVRRHIAYLVLDCFLWMGGLILLLLSPSFSTEITYLLITLFLGRFILSGENAALFQVRQGPSKYTISRTPENLNALACIFRLIMTQTFVIEILKPITLPILKPIIQPILQALQPILQALQPILQAILKPISQVTQYLSGNSHTPSLSLSTQDLIGGLLVCPLIFIVLYFIRIPERKREIEASLNRELVMQHRGVDRLKYFIDAVRAISRRFSKLVLETIRVIVICGAVLLFTYGLVWLLSQAISANSWTWRIIYGAIPVLFLGFLAWVTINLFSQQLWVFVCDAYFWLRLQWPREPFSRPWIAEHYTQFKSGFWRTRFVAGLRSTKVDDKDWPFGPPYKDDTPAAAELARLDERWRELDR